MANSKIIKKARGLSDNSVIAALMVVCTLVIVASFLLSKQLLGDIRFNSKVISRKNAVNQTLERNVDALAELGTNFDLILKEGPQPSKVLQALPLNVDYQALAGEYETMTSSVGARLISISLEADQTAESATTPAVTSSALQVPFRVTAICSYDNLQKFIETIQKSQRPTKIQAVTISGAEPSVTADFTLLTYYQPAASVEPAKETIR